MTNSPPTTRDRRQTSRQDGGAIVSSALTTSIDVLRPHRVALRALTPVLVGDPRKASSRRRRRSRACASSRCSNGPSPRRAMHRGEPSPRLSAACSTSSTSLFFSGGCWTRARTNGRRVRSSRSPATCCHRPPSRCVCHRFGASSSRSTSSFARRCLATRRRVEDRCSCFSVRPPRGSTASCTSRRICRCPTTRQGSSATRSPGIGFTK